MLQFIYHTIYNDKQEEQELKLPVFLGMKDFLYFEHKEIDLDDSKEFDKIFLRALKKGHKRWHKNFNYSDELIEDIMDSCMFDFFGLIPEFQVPKKK